MKQIIIYVNWWVRFPVCLNIQSGKTDLIGPVAQLVRAIDSGRAQWCAPLKS